MNQPDNFKGANMDDRPEEKFPVEIKAIENVQAAYRECVESIIHIMKRRGLTNYKRTPKRYEECIDRASFDGLSDLLKASGDDFQTLSEIGYDYNVEGDDCDKFFDRMYALLKLCETDEYKPGHWHRHQFGADGKPL